MTTRAPSRRHQLGTVLASFMSPLILGGIPHTTLAFVPVTPSSAAAAARTLSSFLLFVSVRNTAKIVNPDIDILQRVAPGEQAHTRPCG